MNKEAVEFWKRAVTALKSARLLVSEDPDGSASRAYYAASALFGLNGRVFTSHKAIRTSVHRDLVKPGIWSKSLGRDYDELLERRQIGDYGAFLHLSSEDAEDALLAAKRILRAVHTLHSDIFPMKS